MKIIHFYTQNSGYYLFFLQQLKKYKMKNVQQKTAVNKKEMKQEQNHPKKSLGNPLSQTPL